MILNNMSPHLRHDRLDPLELRKEVEQPLAILTFATVNGSQVFHETRPRSKICFTQPTRLRWQSTGLRFPLSQLTRHRRYIFRLWSWVRRPDERPTASIAAALSSNHL